MILRFTAVFAVLFFFCSGCAQTAFFRFPQVKKSGYSGGYADFSGKVRCRNGIVWISVPMVEQKIRGLCAPATIERVMTYYGRPLKTSDMAVPLDVARTSGVNVQKLLEKVSANPESRCDVKEFFGFGTERFEKTLNDYNAAAAREGKPKAEWNPLVLNLSEVFASADPGLLRKVAAEQPGKRKFWKCVRKSADSGVPLVWGVVLGAVPEQGVPSGTKGGHLRLIVGYCEKTREVIYSDSWGEGHERKRMSLDDAWAMTMTLHTLLMRE